MTLLLETCTISEVNGTTHEKIPLTKCVVANSTWEISGQLGNNNTIVPLSPKITNVTEFNIYNAAELVCLQKGKFAVKGKILSAEPEGEVAMKTHKRVSDGEGSEAGGLVLGAEKARLTHTLEITLSGIHAGAFWWGE